MHALNILPAKNVDVAVSLLVTMRFRKLKSSVSHSNCGNNGALASPNGPFEQEYRSDL